MRRSAQDGRSGRSRAARPHVACRGMDRPIASTRVMAQGAALARISEMTARTQRRPQMATQAPEHKQAERAMWALGDYHRFATALVWSFGPELVAACRIAAGQRVLDVAAGTGNVALRAAEV